MAWSGKASPYSSMVDTDQHNEQPLNLVCNPQAALFRGTYQSVPFGEGDLDIYEDQRRQLSVSPTYCTVRLRRQPSQGNLGHQHSNVAPSLKDETYPDTPPHTAISTPNFSPSLLLPLLGTPALSHSATSPTLSCSTFDTLLSAPSPPPPTIVNGSYPTSPRLLHEGDAIEPLRSKRKFTSLRRAKRLPHPHQDVWQVHAAVRQVEAGINSGIGNSSSSSEPNESDREASHRVLVDRAASVKAARRRKGASREVRFNGVDDYNSSHSLEEQSLHPVHQPQTDSPFPISDIKFPFPPGQNWEGTFGHLGQPASPRSLATLQYRGADFDVVNPHESLLLGNHQFETPAEIDGLLDDYFNDHSILGDAGREQTFNRMSSHPSLTGSESSRRTRVLYENAESARYNILHVQAGSLAARSNDEFSLRDLEATVPAPLNIRRDRRPQDSRARNIRNSVLGFLGLNELHAVSANDNESNPEQELQEAEEGQLNSQYLQESDDIQPHSRHASSLYPPDDSRETPGHDANPFVISDDSEDNEPHQRTQRHLQLDHPLRTPYQDQYASDHDFNSRGEVDQADESTGQDNTIDRIYMSYSRPYVRGKDNVSSGFIARYRDSWPSLSDSEDDRGHTSDWHTSNEDMEDVKTNAAPQLSEGLSKRTIASDQPLRIPPRVPAPIPPLRDCDRRTTNPYVHPIYSDLPDTEQTYGATDQLLASPTTVRVGSDAQKESPTYASRSRTETTIALAESGNAMHAHNIGIAMTTNCRTASDVPELPSIWSNSDFRQARSRQNVCRSHTHTRQAGSQDGSEWATEVDSQDGNEGYLPAVPLNPFARCPRPVSGDSYADTSVYESAFDDNDYQTVVTRHEVGAARRFPEEQHDADMCGMPLTDQLTVNRRQDAVENLRQVRQRRREHAAAEDAIDQVTAHMSPAEPAGAMSMVHEDSPLDRISKSCKYWGDFLKSSLWSESTRAVKSDTELSILNGGNPTNRGDSSSMGDYRSRASMRPETSTPNSGLLQPAQDSWTPLPFPAAAHVNTTSRTPMRPRRMRAGQQESVERQIELQPLNLARDRAPARSRYGPLTDSELILHEPRWTEHVRSRSLLPTITAFSTTAARDRQQVNAHDSLEGWWVEVCLAFPLSPLLLGLGAFDWAVRHFSRGRITEVAPSLKRASLTTMLPLNLLVWGVIAGMVTLFVWIGHRAAGGE